MSRNPAPKRSIKELNQLRRDAVGARLDGATLADTSRLVGLSAPTIIAAFRAYKKGGWEAVDVAPRGKARRDEQARKPARAGSAPDAAAPTDASWRTDFLKAARPAPGGTLRVWSIDRVTDWLNANGYPLARATVLNQLNEQNLQPASRHRRLIDRAGDDYTRFARRSRRRGTTVLWLGSRRLSDGTVQLFAHDPRGRAWWALLPHAPTAREWLSFIDTISRELDAPVALIVPGTHLVDDAHMSGWLADSQTTHLVVADSPDKPAVAAPPTPSPQTPSVQDIASTRSERTRSEDISLTDNTVASTGDTTRRPLTHLERLEAESIHIMREVVAEADNPVMLYSVGKDSAVMLHLARKAFHPAPPPFPLMHVDTTWKFSAMYEFRDRIVEEYGIELIKHVNPDGIAQGVNPFTHGSALHTDIMKTEGLKQALDKHRFDIAFGGARRDEEKSRAKERVFSFRTPQHRWEPKDQRPELWSLYNARKRQGESIRVFPISNWTELDVWQYIYRENIPIVPLYLAAERPVVMRDGTMIMVDDDRMPLRDGEVPEMRKVRFRTLGCYPLTGAVESDADTLTDVIREMLLTKTSERQGRMIDHDSAASMEKKKQEGYF